MLEQFLDFETELFTRLDESVQTVESGVLIQRSRFKRDRLEVLRGVFRSSFERHPELVDFGMATIERLPLLADDPGNWGEIGRFIQEAVRSTLPVLLKTELVFYGAAIASQQIEGIEDGQPSGVPYLDQYLRSFFRSGRSILLSSRGFLEKNYGLRGLVRVDSDKGRIQLRRAPDETGLRSSRETAERVLELARKHGWSIPDHRMRFLEEAKALSDLVGLCELEVLAQWDGREELRRFLSRVFPVWLPDSLGLTISYFCNASCGHCYNASGSNRPRECLRWEEIRESVRQWAEAGIDEVGLSGGEPFLFPEQTTSIIAGLRGLGVGRILPFSNGFWGADPEQARKILLALKAVGFGDQEGDQIKISVGEFHLKDIALDSVFTVCRLHHEILGRKAILDVESIGSQELVKKILFFAREIGVVDLIDWKLRGWISDSGRGRKIYQTLPKEALDLSKLSCPVKSRGALYPESQWVYCTGTIHPKRHLELGNLQKDSIYSVLAKAQSDDRMIYLQFGSFEDFVSDTMVSRSPLPESIARNATPCSVCRQVFSK